MICIRDELDLLMKKDLSASELDGISETYRTAMSIGVIPPLVFEGYLLWVVARHSLSVNEH